MTGVGLAAGDSEIGAVRIEVRSVNGRALNLKLRLPPGCSGLEAAIDEKVRAALRRGSVTVVLERAAPPSGLPDREQLRRAANELRELAAELGLAAPTVADVVGAVNAAGRGESGTSRPLPEQLAALFDRALDALLQSRRDDGVGTARAIAAQLDELEAACEVAASRAPQVVDEYRTRLLQRVQEFVAANVPSPPPAVDLVREVALFADKVDVAEELQRLRAHLTQARALLRAGGEIGRRLEFLAQELLRETNTLGSKSPDTQVAHTVVEMKSCIDRIKEQVANLE
ncbi:MAG: YicC/YloC family endoribonuclease [Planctomycetota bacterium]